MIQVIVASSSGNALDELSLTGYRAWIDTIEREIEVEVAPGMFEFLEYDEGDEIHIEEINIK